MSQLSRQHPRKQPKSDPGAIGGMAMKPKALILIAIFGLALGFIPFSVAFSQDSGWQTSLGADLRSYNVNGSTAKFNEYKDLRTGGVFGQVDTRYDSSKYFFTFLGSDMGYDTQHYRFEGGSYGRFKYFLDYNEIVHNLTNDARTFYGGLQSGALTGAPNTNPNSWPTTFDYSTKRKKFDSGFKVDLIRPFYFDIAYSNEQKEGVKPTGVASATPGKPMIELPEPVDYTTNTLKVEGGYSKKPFFLSFSYLYSDFKNRFQDVTFTPPPGGFAVPLSLSPDSSMHKIAVKGSAKLPWNSRFNMNISDSWTSSSTDSPGTFDGKVDTRNYNFSLTTNPLRWLDAKVYYKYYERDNKSSGVQNVGGVLTPINRFYYSNEAAGAEVGFKLPAKFYLNTGYKIVQLNRELKNETNPANVLPYTYDNIYFADLKWSRLDFMSAKIGYERLDRGADYRTFESSQEINRRFAYAAQDRDTFKAAIDLFPTENLNFGLEYRYKRSNYNDTILGVHDDTRDAFSFTGDYAFKKFAKLYGYFDYEKAVLNQSMITGQVLPAPQPSRWDSKQEETTYGYGVRADVYAVPKKLTFIFQYDYLRNSGSNDFGFYDSFIYNNIGVPLGSAINSIPNVDSYQKYSYKFTTVYEWSQALTLRLGYAYERYIYSDAQYDNYQYFAPGPGNSQGYLTGAYANPSYSANVVFCGFTYRFQ